MNRTYDENRSVYSENGIYEGSFGNVSAKVRKDGFVRFLFLLIRFLTSAKVRGITKAISFAGCLCGMIAVIAAMEAGSLPLLSGVLIAALLIAAEVFCLRGKRA